MISKNIYLSKWFLIFLLVIILTGNFNYFFPYFLLIFIHEIGHALMGIMLGFQVSKIMFYPLGGVTIINMPINSPLFLELLILIMGPLFQIMAFYLLQPFFPFIKTYHYVLLVFNLLPIYPLDGGKILNLLCCYFNNYLFSFKLSFIISIITLIGLFIYNICFFNLNLFTMTIMLFIKIIKIYEKRFYYYQRLLLERYMYQYSFNRIRNIKNINYFYRDCYHYIDFMDEKKYLKKYFEK